MVYGTPNNTITEFQDRIMNCANDINDEPEKLNAVQVTLWATACLQNNCGYFENLISGFCK